MLNLCNMHVLMMMQLVTTPTSSLGAPLSTSCPLPSSPLSSSPSSFLSSAPEHVVVASYTLKPPEKSAYNTSGNVLMIGEAWGASLGPGTSRAHSSC